MTGGQIFIIVYISITVFDWLILSIIFFGFKEMYRDLFDEIQWYYIFFMFCVPLMNIIGLYATIIDAKDWVKHNKSKKLKKIKNLNEFGISQEVLERIDAISTMAALVDYNVQNLYRVEVEGTIDYVLKLERKDRHHNLVIRYDLKKVIIISLCIMYQGTTLNMGTDDLEKAIKLIEENL